MSKPIILFKLATRGRRNDFFETMESIYDNVADKENMHVLITAGEDDLAMNDPEVIERVKRYKNAHLIFGENTSKSQATNRDMDLKDMPWSDWDILINTADDQRFIFYGFDDIVRNTMLQQFPNMDGFIHLFEPDAGAALAVLYCAGRKYFEMFGFIAHPAYKSLFWDNFYQDTAKLMGKYFYVPDHLFNHLCPAYTHHGKPRDEMFNRDQALWSFDEAVYYKHRDRNYDITTDVNGQFKFTLNMD